jgi:hypothetical protein
MGIRYVRGHLRPAVGYGYGPREQNDTVMVTSSRQEDHSRIGQAPRGLLECRENLQIEHVRDL